MADIAAFAGADNGAPVLPAGTPLEARADAARSDAALNATAAASVPPRVDDEGKDGGARVEDAGVVFLSLSL